MNLVYQRTLAEGVKARNKDTLMDFTLLIRSQMLYSKNVTGFAQSALLYKCVLKTLL